MLLWNLPWVRCCWYLALLTVSQPLSLHLSSLYTHSFYLVNLPLPIHIKGQILFVIRHHFLLQLLGCLHVSPLVSHYQEQIVQMATICLGILWRCHYWAPKLYQGFAHYLQGSHFHSRCQDSLVLSSIDYSGMCHFLYWLASLYCCHEAI